MTTTLTGPKRPRPVRPTVERRTGRPSGAEHEAWTLVAPHRRAVVTYLRRRCRDIGEAEDLAHDTLLRAILYGGALARVRRPRAWLVQIAANVKRDFVRKQSRVQLRPHDASEFLEIPGTEPVPGDVDEGSTYSVDGRAVDHSDLVAEVDVVWDRLPERDRRVLAAYYREGGSTRDAARAVEVSPALAKVRLFRARRRLEAALRERLTSRSPA